MTPPCLLHRARSHALLGVALALGACGVEADDGDAQDDGAEYIAETADELTTANLALFHAVTASSSERADLAPAGAVDGTGATRWSSGYSDAQWLRVDLGAARSVDRVVISWEAAYAKAFQIQTSTDGTTWKTVYNTTTAAGGTTDIRFTAVSARYVRMLGIKRATQYGYSIYELGVFGTIAALPTDAVFAPTSFWYQKIPTNVALHANSAGFVADFQRQVQTYYGNVGVNTTAYASPVYTAAAGAATVPVKFWDCQNKGYADASLVAQWAAVPMPSYAVQSAGTDAEMTVYQPSTNSIWEFWQARKVNGQWQACWGGRMQNTTTTQGIWPSYYGTTATGLPFLGGQVTAEELARGEIRHAIGIALVETEKASVVSWPAQRSDGYNPNNAANRIPEGLRFRLDPTINVDALNIHPVAKIIAKAAQTYGFVVWDKSGVVGIRMQNPLSYTALGKPDPYTALFNGTPTYALLNGIPWNRLQFLPMNYGKQ